MTPLGFAPVGEKVIIRKITNKATLKRYLSSLGFLVGEAVTIVSKTDGNMIIAIKDSRIALGSTLTSSIMI